MVTSTDQVRRDIERARADLGQTLEAIGDRVAPKKVVARTKENVHERVEEVKETVKDKMSPSRLVRRPAEAAKRGAQSVMGVAEAKKNELANAAGSVKDSVSERAQQAQGNPLAVGVLALAAGFFAASLLKSSERERQVAEQAKALLEPVKHEALQRGRQVAEALEEDAKERFHEVAGKAQEAAAEVKEEAASTARTLKSDAKAQAQDIKGDVRRASTTVKRTARASAAPRRPPSVQPSGR